MHTRARTEDTRQVNQLKSYMKDEEKPEDYQCGICTKDYDLVDKVPI